MGGVRLVCLRLRRMTARAGHRATFATIAAGRRAAFVIASSVWAQKNLEKLLNGYFVSYFIVERLHLIDQHLFGTLPQWILPAN